MTTLDQQSAAWDSFMNRAFPVMDSKPETAFEVFHDSEAEYRRAKARLQADPFSREAADNLARLTRAMSEAGRFAAKNQPTTKG